MEVSFTESGGTSFQESVDDRRKREIKYVSQNGNQEYIVKLLKSEEALCRHVTCRFLSLVIIAGILLLLALLLLLLSISGDCIVFGALDGSSAMIPLVANPHLSSSKYSRLLGSLSFLSCTRVALVTKHDTFSQDSCTLCWCTERPQKTLEGSAVFPRP